jgi:hypothetical protein
VVAGRDDSILDQSVDVNFASTDTAPVVLAPTFTG